MSPLFLNQIKKKLKLLVVTFTLLLPFYLLLSSSSLRAQGCGERCWFEGIGEIDCDEPLPCAPGDPPETRVCWLEAICGGDPDPAPTNTPAPTAAPTDIPAPTAAPAPQPGCRAPRNLRVKGDCKEEDGTASVRWTWDAILIAQTYRLQVAFDTDFNNLEIDQVVGPTTSFYRHTLNDPGQIRYARVKLESVNPYFKYEELEGACPGGYWKWSDPPVSSIFYCETPAPPGDSDKPVVPSRVFCDKDGNPTKEPDTGKLYSAIGCIPVEDVQAFTRFFLTWGMRVAGGISFILIVYGGFLFMTSQGNPKKVQAGKELITAAVGGLVYLLFAVFLFRLIGLDILKIPGL